MQMILYSEINVAKPSQKTRHEIFFLLKALSKKMK